MEGLGHEEAGGIDVFAKITNFFLQIGNVISFIWNGILIFMGSLLAIFLIDLIPLSTLGVSPEASILAFNIIKIIKCSIYLFIGYLSGYLTFNWRQKQ